MMLLLQVREKHKYTARAVVQQMWSGYPVHLIIVMIFGVKITFKVSYSYSTFVGRETAAMLFGI